jgi:MurNAc alpha-1-phosphate uridylyltransferase
MSASSVCHGAEVLTPKRVLIRGEELSGMRNPVHQLRYSPAMTVRLQTAMVLAAGLGVRMRPITDRMPKPMVAVGGKPLLDHVLDKLADAGVKRAVVNVHHLADQIISHVAQRTTPQVTISDERNQILGTGGAVAKALPLLGSEPFFHLNADTMWIDGVRPNLSRLAEAFDPTAMDVLLLMAPTTASIGYKGSGDYAMAADGTLKKRREGQVVPFVYAGVAIMRPEAFADAPQGAFELPQAIWHKAEEQGRLFGLRLEGVWMHVGTPDAIAAAERAILASVA